MNPNLSQQLQNSSLNRRVKTPTVIQMEVAECGAAALSIILGYHGRFVSLEELRYQCGVSRDGCNAFNMVEAAKKYGLEAEGFSLNLEELPQLKQPFICHWKGNHFVVLEGCKSQVYINDPATGPRKISYEELARDFSGVALIFKPTPQFVQEGEEPRFWPLAKTRLAAVATSTLLFIFLIQCAAVLFGLIAPGLSRVFLDRILGGLQLDWKWPFIATFALLVLLQIASSYLQSGVVLRLSLKLNAYLSKSFLRHVLKLPILFFTQRYGAEIINRINLNNTVSNTLVSQVTVTLINLLLVVIYGAVMLLYDPLIATVGIVALLISIGMYLAIARQRRDNYSRLQQELAKSTGISIDALQNMESIKVAGTEAFGLSRVVGYKTRNINNIQEIEKKDIWLNSLASFVNQLANVGVLGLGAWRVIEGHLSIGMLAALQMLLSSFLGPISQLIGFSMRTQTLKIDMVRLDDVLKTDSDALFDANKTEKLHNFKGQVELKNVTFGYSPLDTPLLENFNLKIAPGQRVALVGPSGSGKTTLAKLICGLFHPWSGTIAFDGISLEQIPQEARQGALGWVDQDIFIFSGSIRENITLWNTQVPESEIVKAAQDASIHDEILLRKGQYEAQLIEGGNNLSQGQKQRLEIARALLSNPALLVLDEATSALDSETERVIFQNIFKRGCTTVLITHRLSSIKACDTIVVLEKGKIVQMGSHDTLKEISPIYKEMVREEKPQ